MPNCSRSATVSTTCSSVALRNLVLWGTLFQNTKASAPKLLPLTVITKGELLTGTVLGTSVVSAGGLKLVPNVTFGSCMADPQPTEKTTASKRVTERITASWEMADILLLFGRLCVKAGG